MDEQFAVDLGGRRETQITREFIGLFVAEVEGNRPWQS